jgi:hypothetical protein
VCLPPLAAVLGRAVAQCLRSAVGSCSISHRISCLVVLLIVDRRHFWPPPGAAAASAIVVFGVVASSTSPSTVVAVVFSEYDLGISASPTAGNVRQSSMVFYCRRLSRHQRVRKQPVSRLLLTNTRQKWLRFVSSLPVANEILMNATIRPICHTI